MPSRPASATIVADRRLAVVAARRPRPRAEQGRNRQAVAAPGADRRQLGIGVDLDAPGLVVGEMPVEAVELVPGEDFQEPLDLGGRVELPRHVEMDAAPAERRLVADLAGGRKQEGLGMTARAAQDLAERDQAVEQAAARARRNRGAGGRKADRVGLGAEAVAERYRRPGIRPRRPGERCLRPETGCRPVRRRPRPPRLPRRRRACRSSPAGAGEPAGDRDVTRPRHDGNRHRRHVRHRIDFGAALERGIVADGARRRDRDRRRAAVGESEIGSVAPSVQCRSR